MKTIFSDEIHPGDVLLLDIGLNGTYNPSECFVNFITIGTSSYGNPCYFINVKVLATDRTMDVTVLENQAVSLVYH